jgi:hypothetical protein
MDDSYFIDEYDYYNFGSDFDKISGSKTRGAGAGGHAKAKDRKVNLKHDPSGNVRCVVTKLQNAEKKEKQARQRMNSV